MASSLNVREISRLSFLGKPTETNKKALINKTPISTKGEVALLAKGTFIAGLALGGRLLFEIFDNTFVLEDAAEKASQIVEKTHKTASGNKKFFLTVGATLALITAGISGFALLYTLANAPKIAYTSKINTFRKNKEMDVYIKANEAEKEIYTQLSQTAQNADKNEKAQLKSLYLKMRMAKNNIPEFAKF